LHNNRNIFRHIFTPWVFFGAVLFAGILFGIGVFLINYIKPETGPRGAVTAVVKVIPAPSPSPIIPTLVHQDTPTPSPDVIPSPPPGNITVGALVQVTGTGVDGLRFRSTAGLKGEVKFLGIDTEVFKVIDGPQNIDGYIWWKLVAPYDETHQGWAVSNYLAVIQTP
jgi:hypothetical protein